MRAATALALLLATAPAGADEFAARIAAAQRFLAASGFERQVDASIARFAQDLPEEYRATFMDYMRVALDKQRLRDVVAGVMIEIFELDELEALAEFYGSEVGRRVFAKMPHYMQTALPRVQQEIHAVASRYRPPR